jgi:predicted ATP-dependent protease
VGGVNEKIEGFFQVCCQRGLTGSQGVILPETNVTNLMLEARVRQAVEEGTFHIYPVRTIDEGLEILTGVPAGERQQDGSYPENSVHGHVMARLEEIAENLKGEDKQAENGDAAETDPSKPRDVGEEPTVDKA